MRRIEDEEKDRPTIPSIALGQFGRPREPGTLRRLARQLGPGLITGAADDDPSGIGTYSLAGAAFGFATLWTAIVTLPLMAVVQYLCAKIAMVSGRGLAGVLRNHYPRPVLYPAVVLLLLANSINAGADIQAIAAAINLLVPVPISAMIVPIALVIVVLQVWGHYRQIATVFKWLTLSLFAYIAAAVLAKPHWGEVLAATFVPHVSFDHEYLMTLLAILGTTISPYLFFWQASQEVEEEVSRGRVTVAQRRGASDAELEQARRDTIAGMFFCNLVFFFVILACASTLHAAGTTQIETAADAAKALEPLAGGAATWLFAIGMIGAGVLAVPVLTASAAYAFAEALGWKYGLDSKPREAREFYAVIAVATLIGVLIDFVGINPMKALFWTAVINGLLSPPLLVLILLISSNRRIMGRHANGRIANILGWTAAALMGTAALGMLLT